MPRALGPRRAQASGTPPLCLGRRRHRLTLFATLPLSLRALKPQSPAATQIPPLSQTPLPSSRQSSQSPISRDFPPDRLDPARDKTAYACTPSRERASSYTGRSLTRVPEFTASVQPWLAQLAELFCHAGVRCVYFTLKPKKEELICSPPPLLFPLPKYVHPPPQ